MADDVAAERRLQHAMTPCPICHRGFLTRHCRRERCVWLRCNATPSCGALIDPFKARAVSNVGEPQDPECDE